MRFSSKVCLVIVAKNESLGLKKFIPQLLKFKNTELFVLDGMSTDGSLEYLRRNKKIQIFIEKKNQTISMFLPIMLKKTKAKYLIFFQPDGNCDVKKIFKFNKFIKNNYDLIVASRYLQNAKSYDDNLISSIGNFTFTKIVNFLFARFNVKLTDALVGYRAIKIKTLKELNVHSRKNYEFLEKILKVSLSWDIVMTCKILADKSKKYIEFPCSEPKRIGGVEKKKVIKWGISYLAQIMNIYFYAKLAKFK